MENGFIFVFFNRLFQVLYYCNLVEGFKWLARLVVALDRKSKRKSVTDKIRRASSNIAIDIYQIFKFAVIILFWSFAADGILSMLFTFYLIAANLFTYFYYQVWGSEYKQKSDRETDNRRFLNTLIAIFFYIFAFAYLFAFHFETIITWPSGAKSNFDAVYLSLANAFTLPIEGFKPNTQGARLLFVSEVLNTFLFFIIILTNAIPNHINKEN